MKEDVPRIVLWGHTVHFRTWKIARHADHTILIVVISALSHEDDQQRLDRLLQLSSATLMMPLTSLG